MKILDLLERQIETDVQDKNYNGQLRNSRSRTHTAWSSGREDKTDPHMFRKYGHKPLMSNDTRDGYEMFIKYLIDNDITNPHFPNVYNITKVTDRNGKYITKYKTEKLINSAKLSPEELYSVLDSNFRLSKNTEERYATELKHITVDEKGERNSDTEIMFRTEDARDTLIDDLMTKIINNTNGDINTAKLSSFKQATSILEAIKNEYGMGYDIHADNILYRRTPHGIQIVFNDPFFAYGER